MMRILCQIFYPEYSLCENEYEIHNIYGNFSKLITTYVTKGRTSSDMKCRLPCNTEYLSAAPSILRVLSMYLI